MEGKAAALFTVKYPLNAEMGKKGGRKDRRRQSERASETVAKADMPDFVFASAKEADSREGGTTTGNGYSVTQIAFEQAEGLFCFCVMHLKSDMGRNARFLKRMKILGIFFLVK